MTSIKMKIPEEHFPSGVQLVLLRQAAAIIWRAEHEGSEMNLTWDISGDEIVFSWEAVEHPVHVF